MADTHSIEELREALRKFATDRDWRQFHSPKNLSMALSVETAELLELFQWKSEDETRSLSADELMKAREELADVFLYLISLADQLGVDLAKAAVEKLRINAEKYPVHESFGNSRKYSEL